MATKVVMEALSPTMEEGRLAKWNKAEGDVVKSGDSLAEVETDKAIMELVARADGVLRKRLINEGDAVPVGTLIGVIAGADEDIASLVGKVGAAPAAAPTTAPAVPAPASAPAAAPASAPATAPVAAAPAAATTGGATRSSPLARRVAADKGLDLGTVTGSGPGGRIIKRDVESLASVPQVAARSVPSGAGLGAAFTDLPLTQMRKTIAKRLGESIGPIPTFYLTAEFDLQRVSELRTSMAEMGDAYKVSFNDVILKAVATALSQHPEVNAQWLGDKIRQHHQVHLGMAVATDDGLIVPVITNAHTKRMSEISAEAKALAKLARERKLTPEQYTGSTFSVSNLGMFGIDQFTAIINPPECAILAIGGVTDTPVVEQGAIVVRKRLRVTLSCDHRAIDGAVGARFLQTLRRLIENPLMLVY